MENNELEEMRAQLNLLNEKLEGEAIVSEAMLSNATKTSVSKLQRKLLIRMIVYAVLTPLITWFLGPYFLVWCLGIIFLDLFIYLKIRKINSDSWDMARYTGQAHKMIKIYKRWSKFLRIFFSLFFVLLGVSLLVWNLCLGNPITLNMVVFFVLDLILTIIISVSYYIVSEIFVSPDVEITLESVLKDLEKDNLE